MNNNITGDAETDGPRRVGFIGLGNMGSAMAFRLIEAGYDVTVWARTASKVDALVERGAARGNDPEDAIETGVVFSMLSNDDAVCQVFTPERLNAAPEGFIHVNHATISPATALEFDSTARENGSRYVSAPVLGRPEAVAAGKVAILASGDPAGRSAVAPMLESIGRRVWDFGGLLLIVELLIQGLERSVGLRPPLHRGRFRLLPLPEDDPLWARVDTSDVPDIESGLAASDLGLATYQTGDEFIVLVQRPDGIYGRMVPQAAPLDDSIARGEAAERASRGSAARWGLPDFVLAPRTVQRGSATREVGDGTIICGDLGVAVQVKARTNATDNPTRERSWISKKIAEGARQAAGSVRTVQRSPLDHANARGRQVTVDGSSINWIGLIVIDHANPPDALTYGADATRLPYVAVLRREWDFLFDQLRSTTAVVAYLHRIAPDRIAPGTHVANYYELALADERTPPDLLSSRIPDSLSDPSLRSSHPVLPLEPVNLADEYGTRMYRQMLEDIADGPWDRDETDRLKLLCYLDQLPVAERSVIGRRLLTHLGRTSAVSRGTARWDMRRYLLGTAYLHLGYVVCNQFTELHKEAFRRWTMLRHHEWTSALDQSIRAEAVTVAVMLTPRHDAVRPWDTTVFAILGDQELEPGDVTILEQLWNRT